ncbi:MAG: Heavy metal transport/detoxification protein [Candidatus Peregrinibacteria bacterium Greene0416_62]|nr:MAG: Heavy metal transport/detoxification protein [Candidatus Peregrinibacteria bacterium Greene0416_62]
MPRRYSPKPITHRRQVFSVSGMTCRSCELLLERNLKNAPGVLEVLASERRGTVEVLSNPALHAPTLDALNQALHSTKYALHEEGNVQSIQEFSEKPDWTEVGGMLVLVLAGYLLLKRFGLFTLAKNVEDVASLGAVFAVGLVAATSTCLAVVGGLLLAVAAKWTETHQSAGRWERFQPLLSFNAGRLVGYFILGGLVGLLGSAITLTPRGTGMLTLVIAIVMIALGLNILRIVPKRYCTIPLPRAMQRQIHGLSESNHALAPAILGALTFFLPCGFTQSMQLLALGTGNFWQGGIIMLVFALGTLPALLGLSAVSSLAEGRIARWFLTFSGTLVLFLGIFNVQSGLLLTGVDATGIAKSTFGRFASGNMVQQAQGTDPYVTVDAQGRQIVSMTVSNSGYSPNNFTIDAGRQTWIYAVAPQGVGGCASMLTDPTHNLSTPIAQGGNWLGPIVNPQSDFVLTCSMGMMRADVRVRKS